MKNRWLVFAVYLLATLIFYHKALQVYFLSDDWKLFYLLDRHGFSAIAFNFESEFIRIVSCALLSALYFVFGIGSAVPFHLLSVLLHAFNSILVFILAEKIFSRYVIGEGSVFYSFIAGLLFLSLPYQVEAVTWMSGTSDLIACCFVLLSLIKYYDYKISNEKKQLVMSVLFFLPAVLSKESSLFLPLFVLVLELWEKRRIFPSIRTVALFFFPLLFYLAINKLLTGYFITPGISIFTNMSFSLLAENYFLYTAKFFALYRLLPSEIREVLKLIAEHKAMGLMILTLAVAGGYFMVRKFWSVKKSEAGLILLLLMAMMISLLPVIHLETSFVGSPQSDRYGYLPSVFFVILVSVIISFVKRKVIVTGVLCLLIAWFYTGVQIQNQNWIRAGEIVKGIVKKFNPKEGTLYITNIPDNFNGAYVLRNGLGEAASVLHHRDFLESIHVISYQTITSEKDAAHAELLNDSACHIIFSELEMKIPAAEKIFTLVPDTAHYAYSDVSDTSFTVTIKKPPPNINLYFYSRGNLHAVY